MFFDRNEIHIQAFVDFINGKLIIFQSSSPQNIFKEIYTRNIFKNNFQKKIGVWWVHQICISCFLIDMKFISKLLYILLMEN